MRRSAYVLLRPSSLALLASVAIPVLVACGSGAVSLGTDDSGPAFRPIETAAVNVASGACPAGYAHPNVCCTAVPGQPGTCGEYVHHPFQACPIDRPTYADPLTCCALDDETSCIDTPADAGVAAVPSYGCGYFCPPGWSVSADASRECCVSQADGSTTCVNWWTYPPTTTTPPADVDAGPWYGDNYSLCGECPAGWTEPAGERGLCCRTGSLRQQCFTRLAGPAMGVPPPGIETSTCSSVVGGPANGTCSCALTFADGAQTTMSYVPDPATDTNTVDCTESGTRLAPLTSAGADPCALDHAAYLVLSECERGSP